MGPTCVCVCVCVHPQERHLKLPLWLPHPGLTRVSKARGLARTGVQRFSSTNREWTLSQLTRAPPRDWAGGPLPGPANHIPARPEVSSWQRLLLTTVAGHRAGALCVETSPERASDRKELGRERRGGDWLFPSKLGPEQV